MNQEPVYSESSPSDRLVRIRHSLAHVLAEAVLEMRPGSKLGFGPPIEDGFYYDFILSEPLSDADFPEIEERMRAIISRRESFVREELPVEEALRRIDAMGEPYKREFARELAGREGLRSISFYRSGPFVDMCEGPHVRGAGEIPSDAFRLRSIAGAYWRGDSRNVMMTRIYAWAFESRAKLDARVAAYELAQERDHKKLGRELEIFHIDEEIGKGLPLWLPNGAAIREELEKLMRELEFRWGYQRVVTPVLARSALYRRTGHLPYFVEGMYPAMRFESDESYHLRPMNCPHHHKVFASRPRSYRELPLRLAEFGQCFRYEDSGAVSGLLRVRGMCQNDAHIYCSEEQAHGELRSVLALYREAFRVLGIREYGFRLSLHDRNDPKKGEKFIDDPEGWSRAEAILRDVLRAEGISCPEAPGEAAFYGPKIDFQLRSVTGREETFSTIQLDFGMASRLDLSFVGPDGREHRPLIIHRAPLGSFERMVAFLLEASGGAFPTWLAPVQARVLPVSDRFRPYALEVVDALRSRLIRAELDDSPDKLQKKIRDAAVLKIPNLLIVGEREASARQVTLRSRGRKEQAALGVEALVHELAREIAERRRD